MRNFYIDGVSSATYNIYASGENAYNAAERDVTSIEIPGRSGNLIVDNGKFKNIDVKYPCVIPFGFSNNAASIRNWLAVQSSYRYRKITDDYDPSHYRMGRYKSGIEFAPMYTNQAAALFDITFDCKPQRFLTSGDTFIYFTGTGDKTITNPTSNKATPIIRIYGNGTLTFDHGATIKVSGSDPYFWTEIDCETLNCTSGETQENVNNLVEFFGTPFLRAGNSKINVGSGITAVDIKPRWWEL